MDPSEPMRVKVRSGYAFHRITRYVNSDGSLRKEKVSEVIVGPAEITVTAEELQSQEHKVELLDNERTYEACSADADALREEPDPKHSDETTGTSEAAIAGSPKRLSVVQAQSSFNRRVPLKAVRAPRSVPDP